MGPSTSSYSMVCGQREHFIFWDDIWLHERPLRDHCIDDRMNPLTHISEFWHDGQWNQIKLQSLHTQAGLPQRLIDDILKVPILAEEQDAPRWNLSGNGEFSLSSAWEAGRSHRPTILALEDIWNEVLNVSISIFNWRLLSNRIPVDSKLQWRKISLASKCNCCPTRPRCESLQHLFIQGYRASKVWEKFDEWFPGMTENLWYRDTIPDRLEKWSKRIQQPAKNHISRFMPCLILWFIWAERNNSRHNGTKFNPHNVCWSVQMHIQNLIVIGRVSPG